jgi:hypothetical protein
VWAERPGSSKPVAELWINENELLLVLFVDDVDRSLKVEILPNSVDKPHILQLTEMEALLETAKRELRQMADMP